MPTLQDIISEFTLFQDKRVAQVILQRLRQLVSDFRFHKSPVPARRFLPIYHIRVAFDKDYTGLPKHSHLFNQAKQKGLFQIGNQDAEFIDEINIQSSDVIINKTAVL
ncbi:MAG: isochorismatase family protein [Coxiellaceae bacterium]|nr:isochorismatase family protein [Coxiellaceae bacterium]